MISAPSTIAHRFYVVVGAILVACVYVAVPSAHKTIVSPYTYHRDVAPILRERCGSCHAEGGNSFPLTTFAQVKERALPMQHALLSGRMPVWYADPQAAPFKGSTNLSAKELNTILIWAAGGTPEGVPVVAEPRPSLSSSLGKPFVILTMPKAFTLSEKQKETFQETTWPAGRLAGKWIQAADVLPGSAPIVRHATVEIRSARGQQVITHWVPGDTPQTLPGGGAFKVPAGASIVLRVYYHQPAHPQTIADTSRLAIYTMDASLAKPVDEIRVVGGGEWPFNETVTLEQTVNAASRIVALRPLGGALYGRAGFTIIAPDGVRTPLAVLVLRPEWPRRYVFDTPIAVQAGSRIESAVTSSYGISWNSLTGDPGTGPHDGGPLRVVLETIR